MLSHLHPFAIKHLHDAQFIKCLGVGTNGIVKLYKCKEKNKDCKCNKFFVIKQYKHKQYKHKQLLNEYTIGTLLHHHNINETLDVDLEDDCIIYDYFPAIGFYEYIHQNNFNNDDLLYFKQIIDGVEYMHDTGIAHMDLKLENIIIDTNNKLIKIIDFGNAIIFHDSTHINTIIKNKGVHGTIPYIPPEEFKSQEYNPEKCDIWSLGIILYSILYKSLPWTKATVNNTRFYNFYIEFITKNQLNKTIFYKTIYNDLFYKIFNPNPDKRCNIKIIKEEFTKIITSIAY